MTRRKKLTIYVEAYAEMSRDAGSIPAASTNETKKTDMNRKADSRNDNSLSAFFVWKYKRGIKFWIVASLMIYLVFEREHSKAR